MSNFITTLAAIAVGLAVLIGLHRDANAQGLPIGFAMGASTCPPAPRTEGPTLSLQLCQQEKGNE